MKVYLAGPMRGIPELNFPAFHAAAAELRSQGHQVFSPAEQDCERHKQDTSKGNLSGDEQQLDEQFGFAPGGFMRIALADDLAWICAHAEAIALLPGWQYSSGVTAELAVAQALKLEVIYVLGKAPRTRARAHE